ncbi:MAG: alpha/beta hydrolase domain-containing protein, partial [Dehalococcoidia bacterium]
EQWSFARLENGRVVPDASHIYMASGFQPGKVYQVIYSTTGAPVVGLGLLATREIASFLRYATAQEGNPCAGEIEYAYSFGASQSGRFLRHLLYLGLNQDEDDRPVFDGLIPHIAGGRRGGDFNQRFGQPSSGILHGMANLFPFTDTEQTDPETGLTDGLLSRLVTRGMVPKIFFTHSSAEYWRGDAALTHTDVTGTHDIAPSESARIYHFAGTQHASGTFPLADSNPADGTHAQQLFNCVDYRPLLRAALVHLDRWVTSGEAPPPSYHSRVDDGTVVPPEHLAATFRAIPGVNYPEHVPHVSRLDFGPDQGIITKLPPVVGKPYPVLVPNVDQDGNELGGIRLPDLSVPLATHTGWNLRHPDTGEPGQTAGNRGATIPFPATQAEREASGDPRPSIEERYTSREDYLDRVRQAAQVLVGQGYLLAEDIETVIDQAAQHYDVFRSRVQETQAADN